MQAQNAQQLIDNLKLDLKSNSDAKKIASIYSDLTWYYSKVSIDSALVYGKKALESSKKLGDSTLLAQVYSDVGAVYFTKGDFQNSKQNYLTAYKIRKAKKDIKGLAKINNNLANIYERTFQYNDAMKSFIDALQYFESINDQKNIHITKGNIGLVLLKLKSYPKAIEYINEVIQYNEANNLPDELCNSCTNIGNVYLKMKDTVNALKYYTKALKACRESGNNKGISVAFGNIGSIKSEQKKSKEALALYAQSSKVENELNSDIDKSSIKLKVAKELIDEKQFMKAHDTLVCLKRIFEKLNSKEYLLLNYKLLITCNAYLNQPDSVTFYTDKYIYLKDNLLDTHVLKQSQELEAKYQTEKKEKLLLQKEIEAKNKNVTILILSLVALFVGLVGFLIYRQQRLRNKQQHQEFELKSAIAQIETQNKLHEQRLTISRDLHDNIGAQLTFVISSIDNLKYGNKIADGKISNQLTKISDFTKSTIIELRDTIWAMNNSEFKVEDLYSRILNFIEKAKTAKDDINFKFIIDEQLKVIKFSSVVGINLYRTIQEAINNAIKYSEAKDIVVEVKKVGHQIKIAIHDNGKGFDMEKIDFGNGIYNIKKRIEEVNGTCEILSELNKGTEITILLMKNQYDD
jgi:signal transduction histidine kinase